MRCQPQGYQPLDINLDEKFNEFAGAFGDRHVEKVIYMIVRESKEAGSWIAVGPPLNLIQHTSDHPKYDQKLLSEMTSAGILKEVDYAFMLTDNTIKTLVEKYPTEPNTV